MEKQVRFESSGLTLRGTLHVPDGMKGKRPGIVSAHGFGGSSNGAGHPELARALEQAGYAVLRFDFRGCGASDGERGRIICLEEVEDMRNAITFLQSQDGVDRERIGIIGASLGGAVAIHVAAVDARVKACAANGPVASGERLFRFQYPGEEKYQGFLRRLEDARRHRQETGKSVMINRYDIVNIPEKRRAGMPPGSIMSFPAETAISILEFSPDKMLRQIAPRPLLLVHPRGDDVVPVSESQYLASIAAQPFELHITETSDHFASGESTLQKITKDWLARYLPLYPQP